MPKSEFARRDYYDTWLPELAASGPLVSWALAEPWTDARWRRYERRYRAEMKAPAARHLIETLAALSRTADFSIGCYCENPARCHRSILAELLENAGAEMATDALVGPK